MIPRYSREKIKRIWDPEKKFSIWLKIEILICEAQNQLGLIPDSTLKKIKKMASFNVKRIDEIEKEVKHDVIAFLTNLAENIGKDSRFVHQGVTSSDILDTALSIQHKESCKIIKSELKSLINNLKIIAIKYKETPCIGRSHGIFAEPTTFGLKMLGRYCEFQRNYERLINAEKDISICSISGAVGTFANINPKVQEYVAKKLGLKVEDVSTQIIPRDRHAHFFAVLGIIASSIESLSIEIRHLQRSEISEVQEFFSKNQKGSSAMPHKRNPVLSENLTGISRVIRANILPTLENISLWHERDISHSSVERILCPESLILLDFSINRMTGIIRNLVVNKKSMMENLKRTKGLYNSQRVLLQIIKKGITREKAYKIVQKLAIQAWNNNDEFKILLLKSKEIESLLTKKELDKIFDLNYHLKHIDNIFKKVLRSV